MFDFLKKKPKKFKATIANTGQTFEVQGKINLLQAALNEGIKWPHDCRVGSCGTCRCTLKEGKIKPLNDFAYVLDKEMLDKGMILACQSRLTSDITIEVDFDQGALR
ncbi:MAG: 2Fe-2S iron-sulfur cluster binding domain-containing protein [Chromatiales bacterium]|nr:2Fe-2S iron-sulfur cluster binding domain-containing protein [Chromatiales bacterium]